MSIKIVVKQKRWILRGKNNRKNGDRFEMKIHRKIAKTALASARSSGSKGLFDHWALYGDKLRLIIAKVNGYLDKFEREELRLFFETKPKWARVEIQFYRSPKKIGRVWIKDPSYIRPYYT